MRFFAGECGGTRACFDLIIYEFMSGPFSSAGAVPEVDFVPAILAEECLDCSC